MENPTTPKKGNAEALDIDKETIAQTDESTTPKVANLNATNALGANTTRYPVAKYTLVISDDPNLTKHYDLVDEKVEKTAAGRLSTGTVRTVTKPIDQLVDEIKQQATPHHALIHGVSGYDEIRVVTKGNETGDAISRSREHFSYSTNALMMFDHDPSERGINFTFESCTDFLDMLAQGYPAIADAAFVVKPSSSAGIMLGGELVSKQGGFHAYTVARDGSDIPRFTNTLFKRLIIKGHGHAFISRSGSIFVRTVFDNAIYRPEGLDYIAPAIVGEGLTIDQPAPQKFPGGTLDTSLMPDLTEAEEILYKAEHKKLMDGVVEDARDVRGAYLKQRSLNTGVPIEKLAKQYKHGEQGAIDYEMPLTRNDGTQFSFEDVIAYTSVYQGLSMRDPYEPEYGENKAKLYINDNGPIVVHSYCHGKRTYRLFKDGNKYPMTSALKRTTFRLKGINEIRRQPAPLQYLIEDYLIKTGIVMLIGDSGLGKTFLAMMIGLCIATGRSFMGKDVAQGPTVYINAEGHTGMTYRVRAWEQENGTLDDDVPFYLSEQRVDFLDESYVDHAAEVIDAIAKNHDGKIAVIIVDTMHRNMSGDENSSYDIGKFFTSFEDLCKRYGAAGLINHHPGHNTRGRSRGSSAMRPSLDTELLLTKKKGGKIVLEHGKFKDGPLQPDVGYHLREVTLPWLDIKGNPITSRVSEFYPCDGNMSAAKQRGPVPPNIGIALKSLITAIGSAADATKDQWKNAFFNAYSGKPEATRRAFSRAANELVDNGVVLAERDNYRFGDTANCPWTNMRDYLPSSPN